MSGTVTIPATGPLTQSERVDARRFCGFPAYGDAATGQATWFYFAAYGNLEYRLTNMSDPELAVVRTYLSTLTTLEAAIPGAAANLDTQQAAVWTRNPREVQDRERLYDSWRKRLCAFMGVELGPELQANGCRIVV
jgi:hypothetical protein